MKCWVPRGGGVIIISVSSRDVARPNRSPGHEAHILTTMTDTNSKRALVNLLIR